MVAPVNSPLFVSPFIKVPEQPLKVGTPELPGKLSWLRTDGARIVNERGEPVLLRGINLGGWLVEEMWMMPFKMDPPKDSKFKQIKDHVSLWNVAKERFDAPVVDEIRRALRKSWVGDIDYKKVKEAHLNCVRLPFIHDLMDEPGGLFPWLDKAIEKASKHNVYVILDMHGAPGRQSNEDHTGEEGSNLLFQVGAMVDKTVELWSKIAKRYKDNPTVAGYNLLNEPSGAANTATLHIVHDRIYRAIRAHDTRHMIIVEDGFKGIDRMPNIDAIGWQNVVLSTHLYPHHCKSEEEFLQSVQSVMKIATEQQALFKVPIYIGEFNVLGKCKEVSYGSVETVKKVISLLQDKGVSWSLWTYKIGAKGDKPSLWGLYSPKKRLDKINMYTDSKENILKKIKQFGTEHFEENKALGDVLRTTLPKKS